MVMATQKSDRVRGYFFRCLRRSLTGFILIVNLGYPTVEEELEIIDRQQMTHPIESLEPVATSDEVIELQQAIRGIYVDDLVKQYIVTLVGSTRSHADISLGASPRASLSLFRGGQAVALIRGRDFVLPDDVKGLAVPMLSHRMIVSAAARMRGVSSEEVVERHPGRYARSRRAGTQELVRFQAANSSSRNERTW